MKSNKKQIIFVLAILTMALILSCALVACDKAGTDKTGTDIAADYKVTIHPNNGQGDIVWDITKEIPTITKDGYHIAGYFLDAQLTISTTLESLKATGITKNIDVYVKWEEDVCEHVEATDAAIEPTCTEKGLTEGKHCSKCGKILKVQTEIDALGHDLENHDGQEATCTEKGWKAYVTCKRKGCGYTTYQEIPALGHTEVVDDAIAPTCTEKGKTEGKHCSVCNTIIVAQTDVAALGHDIEHHNKKDATCTEIGWDEYDTCKRAGCGYTTYNEIPALGHKYSQDWSNDKTYHWHASTCGHDVVSDKGKHTFDSNWVCTECAYVDTGLHGVELRTNTLELDGTDIYGKVSNVTSTFSFINEIAIADSAKYTVSTDINGLNVIPTKTISLSIGDNTFYILVENGKDLGLYTVVIRRRPMYNVSFNVNGGTSVSAQTIEEDHFATEPTTERKGYTFDKWDYDFSKPIIKDTTITASWNIITYNVYYDLNVPSDSISQDVDNSMNVTTYTVEDAITFQTPSRKGYRFTGWDKNIEKGTTGDVTVTASWEVIEYDIVYDFGDADSVSKATNNAQNPSKYTVEDTITFEEPSRGYYTFSAWNIDKIVPGTTETQTIVASWIAEQHTINFVLSNGWTNSKNNITAYTIEDKTITLYDAIKGESLFCGWYLDEEYKNYIATIDSSTMRDYMVYAYADDSATKGLSIENGNIKGYSGTQTDIVIPSYYKGCSVTSIGSYAFEGCTRLTSITIPESVTSIGSSAFENCTGLTSVTIPDSVTSIGDSAFSGCNSLTSMTLPFIGASVTAYSGYDQVFGYIFGYIISDSSVSGATYQYYGYSKYYYYYIPSSITSVTITGRIIPSCAFENCTGLTNVTIGNNVTNIGYESFSACSGLTSITIPDSVTSIGNSAFSGCKGLTSVTIGESVTSIGGGAFAGCTGLTSITIPDSVTSIGNYAFSRCTGLTSVTIGSGVTSIGAYAFSFCSGLTSITIPDSVTSIGEAAFSGCKGLTMVNWNATACTSAGSSDRPIFGDCSKLATVNIGNNVTTIPAATFFDCSGLTNITIPNGVTSIGKRAFYGCTGLTSITIPDSVTSIGSSAFSGCYKLIEVYNKSALSIKAGSSSNGGVAYCAKNVYTNEGGSKLTTDENGYVIYTDGDEKILVAYRGTNTELVLPSYITKINQYAFYLGTGLTSVTIPDSMTSIGSSAFYGCSGLTSITIPNSVTNIGGYVFYDCSGLTSITIPDSVTSIGYDAFRGCDNLQDIYITDIAAWCNISGLDNLMRYGSNNKNLYINNELATSITIPDGVTVIPFSAFSRCSSLTSVTIGNSVTYIGSQAFYNCIGLTSVTIPDSVMSIGESAFYGCTGLTNITIPDSVTSIGEKAFYSCTSLTSIAFNGTMEEWNTITKGSDWNNGGPKQVICTDGTVSI